MRVWGIILGLCLLGAVAWPVPEPPVRPEEPGEAPLGVEPPAVPTVAPGDPREVPPSSRDPDDPPPPPPPPGSPPPPGTPWPRGEVLGCVEDEDGCAIAAFRLWGRIFGCHRRSGRRAGEGEPGPGGTFRFRVRCLDFHRDERPPGFPPSRSLFSIWADGFVVGKYELGEENESVLRRGGRVTGVRIVLTRALLVQGQVFWPDGRLVKGHPVTVTTRKEDRVVDVSSTRTDKHGWYRFHHLEARAGLSIHAEANLGDSKHRTSSERIPLGDEPAGGDLLHVDLRLRRWESTKE